jgi:hypothetical protein
LAAAVVIKAGIVKGILVAEAARRRGRRNADQLTESSQATPQAHTAI